MLILLAHISTPTPTFTQLYVGKQWKNIATMIGSRTIVQVRTHAQKYFQKMERHGGKPSGFMATSPTSKPKGTLTTRSKKSPKHTLRSTLTHDKNKGTSHHLTADNLYIHDKAFLMDEWRTAPSVSSLENSSTISPDNVLDFAYQGTSEGLYLDYPLPQSEGNNEEERAQQQQQSSQEEEEEDPLEWLMEGGLNHLPESTLVDPMATVHGSEDFPMLDHVPSMWLDGGLVLAKDE